VRNGTLAGLVALLAWPCVAHAEDGKLDVSAEVRVRVEAIDGQFRPGVVPSDLAVLTRVLAAAEYDAGPIRVGGEIIDARSFFERRGSSVSTTEVDALEPIQAYLARHPHPQSSPLDRGRTAVPRAARRQLGP
jgi:hypothetical protein